MKSRACTTASEDGCGSTAWCASDPTTGYNPCVSVMHIRSSRLQSIRVQLHLLDTFTCTGKGKARHWKFYQTVETQSPHHVSLCCHHGSEVIAIRTLFQFKIERHYPSDCPQRQILRVPFHLRQAVPRAIVGSCHRHWMRSTQWPR